MKSIRAFFIFFVQRLLSLSILLFFVLVQAEILNANTTPLLWSFEIGNPGHIPISSYAISSDGSYIAVGVKSFEEQERGLYLFSKESNNWLWKFPSEQNGVTSVDISADGSYLVAYDHWHDLHLFNKNSDTPIWSFSPENYLGRVVISGDGNYIVASEGGGTLGETRKLYLFHRSSNIPLWTKTFATGGGGPISISYDGSYIVLGAIQLHLFHKSSNTPIWTFEGGGDVSISADGSYITLTGGGETPYFYLFHSSSNLPLWNFTSRASASISGDGNFIAVAGRSYTGGARGFLLLNRGSNIPQWIYETENAPDYPISISDDGKYLVGTENGKIYLFNRENNEPLWVYGSEPYWIYRREFKSALISGDGNYMVAAENNSISLFNVTFNLPSEVWVDQNFCETCLNGGHSWGYDAFSNIQDGIDVLWNGGNVHVASGTYLESSFEWGYDDYAVLIYRDNVKLIGEGRDTTIIDSDQDANRVLIWGKGSKLKGFTIKNSGNQYNGVYIYNSNNCNVSENKIINNGNGLNLSLSGDCIIKDNLIYNNHSTGIANYDSSSNVIANNIIGLNKWSGISSNSDDTFIYNNVINQNGTGIRFEYTSGNLLVNNTLVSNDLGIYSYESWINIFNSIIYDNEVEIDSQGSPENYSITYSNIEGGWFGEGNIDIDPYFEDSINGDFHLKNYSPCIGEGKNQGAPNTDLEGNPRPNPFGSNPDMGAYENSLGLSQIPSPEDILDIFGMELNNSWSYEGTYQGTPYSTGWEIIDINQSIFPAPTYIYEVKENGVVVGTEWYENTGDQIKLWQMTIEDEGSYYNITFSQGLIVAWAPMEVFDHKYSEATTDILGLPFNVSMTVDVLSTESVALAFDTLEAYKVQYQFHLWGNGIDQTDTFFRWIVPYLGNVKEQGSDYLLELTSFDIGSGSASYPGDKDDDGLEDYDEFFTYNTHWLIADSDDDGLYDGSEVVYWGTEWNDDPDGDLLINLLDSDSDNDGLSDGVEVNILGTDPTLTDTDKDGISDIDEDTDMDGFSNAQELECGSDPADPYSRCSMALPWLMLLLD